MRHRFHAICPYFAMFPESFAERWIAALTKPGEIVLDPFCGRGTAPFQALLMGRRAVGVDTNPVAYCVTRAKTNAPGLAALRSRLTTFERGFRAAEWEADRRRLPDFFKFAYQPTTLRQILYLRDRLRWADRDTDCLLATLCLRALHGESNVSPSYLSNQMPRTISTKPAYSIRFWKKHRFTAPRRDVFKVLREQLRYRYESTPPRFRARIIHGDMRDLPRQSPRLSRSIRCVITSPPYLNVTSYEEDQWLRLWFLGGPPFPTTGRVSPDDRYKSSDKYWRMIGDMWRSLGQILDRHASIVIRLGVRGLDTTKVVAILQASSAFAGRSVRLLHQEASEIQRRQTDVFRPGTKGCRIEVDCHFRMS